MVEISEESSTRHDESAGSRDNSASSSSSSAQPGNAVSYSDYFRSRPTDGALFGTRVATILLSLIFLLPLTNPSTQQWAYYKALVASAATSALRLHQRVGGVEFSREYLARVLLEDASHYLFYSLIFVTAAPVTMALLPVFLFALLHATNFYVHMANATGSGNGFLAQKASQITSTQTQNILGVIAVSEIFMIPLLVALILGGKGSLVLPFVYYRFLTLRYASRRNPYTRAAFSQMRASLESVATNASCPGVVRTFILKSVEVISRLAPPLAA